MARQASRKTTICFTALGHPLRRRILREMLDERTRTSPRELAAELGEPLSNVSYHVRVLAECGADQAGADQADPRLDPALLPRRGQGGLGAGGARKRREEPPGKGRRGGKRTADGSLI